MAAGGTPFGELTLGQRPTLLLFSPEGVGIVCWFWCSGSVSTPPGCPVCSEGQAPHVGTGGLMGRLGVVFL